jgi:hypothetical protein
MKTALGISTLMLLTSLNLGAQGRGQSHGLGLGASPHANMALSSQGSIHSNAPAGTPSASRDRDTGRDRASDVGKGKKKGLSAHGKAGATSQGSVHSNAPAGTPAASPDRDTGRDRASDVGKGK